MSHVRGGYKFGLGNDAGYKSARSKANMREFRQINETYFIDICEKYLMMTREQILAASKDHQLPMLEAWVVSIISKAIKMGDTNRLDFLLNRMIGRVRTPIEIVTPPLPPEPIEIDLSRLSLETLKQLEYAKVIDVTPEQPDNAGDQGGNL